MNNFAKIHPESESHNGRLQKELRETLAFSGKGMTDAQSVNESSEKSERRRDQAAGGEYHSNEEEALVHFLSLQIGAECVQAAISIGNKFFLSMSGPMRQRPPAIPGKQLESARGSMQRGPRPSDQ